MFLCESEIAEVMLYIHSIAESSIVENGKPAGHVNGSAIDNSAKGSSVAEAEPRSDGTKQAFLPLEQVERGQAKASVIEVFKKVPSCGMISQRY